MTRKVIFNVPWISIPLLKKYLKTDWEIIPFNPQWKNGIDLDDEIIAYVGFKPSKDLLKSIKGLKYHITQSAGYEWADEEFYRKQGIILINSHANAVSVAEHAIALFFALMKDIVNSDRLVRERKGIWLPLKENMVMTWGARNKKALIFGTGAIGKEIAKRLKAFEMKIIGIKRKKQHVEYFDEIYTLNEFKKVLGTVDAIFIAIPLSNETKNLLKKEEMELIKETAFIINVARAQIIDEEALYNALKERLIGGAGLDVHYVLPWETTNGDKIMYHFPFHELNNVILTPYRAWYSDDTVISTAKDIAYKLDCIATGKEIPDVVIHP